VPSSALLRCVVLLPLLPLLSGCLGPFKANIALRKEVHKQREQIAKLESQRQAEQQQMLALERSATTVPVLPAGRLANLYVAQGLAFGKLTGGASSRDDLGHHDLVKVYVTPTDQEGQSLKAAGSLKVNVFDLSKADSPLLASREWSTPEAMKAWFGRAMLYCYVLEVPLERQPSQPEVTISVTFTDELTQRQITADRKVKLQLKSQ
jgi:hypothetical protein